jgi:chemotaxis family two-component system response regulator Rcp1
MTQTQLSTRPMEVLLVEDNPSDVALTRTLLGKALFPSNLSVAYDGEEAMAFVRQEGTFTDSPTPDLILLDLNLPRKGGLEVLAELKADRELRRIPVIVLTTSGADRDVQAAYEHHSNAYVTKPVDLDQFTHIISAIEEFWLSIVRLPEISG